jgi:hypothetical protein
LTIGVASDFDIDQAGPAIRYDCKHPKSEYGVFQEAIPVG